MRLMVLLCLVGCSEPAHEALLVQRQIDSDCQLERVVPGQGEPRVLALVPHLCRFSQILFAPDGSRLLLASFPMSYEVDLVNGEVRTLPKPPGSYHPHLPPPGLHLDGQGAVLWEIPQGEGKADYDDEGSPSWSALRYQLHALRDGAWVVEGTAIEPEGSPPSPERLRFEARFSSEIALGQKFPYMKGEMAGPELRAVLDEVSGTEPLKWHVDGRFAQPFTSSGLGFPVLLKVGERWQALPVRSTMASEVKAGHEWLIVRQAGGKGHAYSLATGEEVWTGTTRVAFWPAQVSAP
jgi:hypothetical protein